MQFYLKIREESFPLAEEIAEKSPTLKNLANEFNLKKDYVIDWTCSLKRTEDIKTMLNLLTEDVYCGNFRIIVETFKLADWLNFNDEQMEQRIWEFFVSDRKEHFRTQFKILEEISYSKMHLENLFNKMKLTKTTVSLIMEVFHPELDKEEAIRIYDKDEFTFRKRSEHRKFVWMRNLKQNQRQVQVLVTKQNDDYKEWIVNYDGDFFYLNPSGQLIRSSSVLFDGIRHQKMFPLNNELILEDSAGYIIQLYISKDGMRITQKDYKKIDLIGKLVTATGNHKKIIVTKHEQKNLFWILNQKSSEWNLLTIDDELQNCTIIELKFDILLEVKTTAGIKCYEIIENNLIYKGLFKPKKADIPELGPDKRAVLKLDQDYLLTETGKLWHMDYGWKRVKSKLFTKLIQGGQNAIFIKL